MSMFDKCSALPLRRSSSPLRTLVRFPCCGDFAILYHFSTGTILAAGDLAKVFPTLEAFGPPQPWICLFHILLGIVSCTATLVLLVGLPLSHAAFPPDFSGSQAVGHTALMLPGLTLPWSRFPMLWLGGVTALFVHEAGHAFAAAAFGVPVRKIAIGLRWVLVPTAMIEIDLFAASSFREGSKRRLRLPCQTAFVTLCAGPGYNFLLTGVCALPLRYLASGGSLATLLAVTGANSLALGIVNMFPSLVLPTDGSRVIDLLFGSSSTMRYWINLCGSVILSCHLLGALLVLFDVHLTCFMW